MTKRTPLKQQNNPSNEEDMELGTLIHLRGMAQGNITRIKNVILQSDVDDLTVNQVKVYIRKVESSYAEYHTHHQQLIARLPADKRQEQDEKFIQFETLHEQVSTVLDTCLETLAANAVPQQPNNQQPIVIQPSLPRVIPTFDGRYENWEKFKVMFKDVVDGSNEHARIKLYHLEKALVGDAAGLIDAKTISDGNYDRAWQLLEERFEDKRRMIDLHIGGILGVKKLSKESYTDLRALVETFENHIENLKFLGEQFTGVSERFIIYIVAHALDDDTKKLWEATVKRRELPTYSQTIAFLKERVSVLERCQTSDDFDRQRQQRPAVAKSIKPPQRSNAATAVENPEPKCEFCNENHLSFKCSKFNESTVKQRMDLVREKNVCFNCLRKGHRVTDCLSERSCTKCGRRHHTLLHSVDGPVDSKVSNIIDGNSSQSEAARATPVPTPRASRMVHEQSSNAANPERPQEPVSQALLFTALVNVLDRDNRPYQCRALLDCGSQVSFITQSLAHALNVEVEQVNLPITGIGSVRSTIKQRCTVSVQSRCNDFAFDLHCLVSPRITGELPSMEIHSSSWNFPRFKLADPLFYKPHEIDMLIGMDWFLDLLKPGFVRLTDDCPRLQDSQLGWLIGGRFIDLPFSGVGLRSNPVVEDPVGKLVQKFWEIEGVSADFVTNTEEEEYERLFQETYRRQSNGRYMVQLPLKDSVIQLPDSRTQALRRFYALESKLQRQPNLKEQYDSLMDEYELLGHCKEVFEADDDPNMQKWYLPHHAVVNPSKTTTKCRVVFDASSKVAGTSLNDVLMVGAAVQSDLMSIELRFRMHRYVMSADVSKMFRQIDVDSRHSPLQRIFWRKSPTDRLRTLELTTVTYGTASAPFLATRTMLQLARDERDNYPLAAEIVEKNVYVDDGLFGSNSFEEACEMQRQVIALFKSGGMHLHKWSSNDPRLLESIPSGDQDSLVVVGDCEANEIIKTLGLMWNPKTDEFVFLTQPPPNFETPTKRQVLSTIAKIFDPLGLISPVIIIAKILMQRLWISKLKWDERLDDQLCSEWQHFLTCLPCPEQIRIPRHIVSPHAICYELHGFSDASEMAYGACVYIRSLNSDDTAVVKLVASKSKIAPINPVSIPRKELLAALLLTKLVSKVVSALDTVTFTKIQLWSDSQVVLAWLQKPLNRLQVFVRNRVAEIVSHNEYIWSYVNTRENPADIVSRGQCAKELAQNDLWWNGPKFLKCQL
ncbi:uncharacterized protein LOC134288104 [Aedes albopictus]|uniref:CCHC-type domain-containing protein n=1 Tax=Aedes albopictus TaxID=7160 RepID=A0ABM1ZSG9_AEDAL